MAAGRDNAGCMVNEFKEARRRRAIELCKGEKWKEFYATVDQDPWGRPYRAKMARNVPPEGL